MKMNLQDVPLTYAYVVNQAAAVYALLYGNSGDATES